jgi:AbrB family looped-hinge helix DNA binding protein
MTDSLIFGHGGDSMRLSESGRIGRRGTFVIPARLRRIFGLEEGSQVIAEETPEGILIRPAVTVPVEIYSAERKAEFLLSNAVDNADYLRAVAEVRRLGLDPATIEHVRPDDA